MGAGCSGAHPFFGKGHWSLDTQPAPAESQPHHSPAGMPADEAGMGRAEPKITQTAGARGCHGARRRAASQDTWSSSCGWWPRDLSHFFGGHGWVIPNQASVTGQTRTPRQETSRLPAPPPARRSGPVLQEAGWPGRSSRDSPAPTAATPSDPELTKEAHYCGRLAGWPRNRT